MDMNSFLSWATLGTFAGATACTGLFTQLLTSIIKKVPSQWLSFLIALVLLAVTPAATGGWMQPWTVWALVPLNALLVSLASNGAVDAMRAMKGNKTS